MNYDQKIKEFEKVENKIQSALIPVSENLKKIKNMISRNASLIDRYKDELKKAMDEYSILSKKMEFMKGKKSQIIQKRDAPQDSPGEICITEIIYPMVILELYKCKKEIRETVKEQRYSVKDDQIQMEQYGQK